MEAGRVWKPFLGLIVLLPAWSKGLAEPASDWRAQAVSAIQAREYELSPNVGGWEAPNRAHGLRTSFTGTAVQIAPREQETPAWKWGLALMGVTRAPVLSASGNRLDRDWGGITEWYVNDPRGLEHGFTLSRRFEGRAGRAHLELALTGTLDPIFSSDGQTIDFRTPQGAIVLRYAALHVEDARGRALSSRMEGFTNDGVRGIRIVFDDRDAVYPVTVDPLATSVSWTGEGNQASANFGTSVAPAGDVNGDGYSDVIVGADTYDNGQTNEGRAFVFLGGPSGLAAAPAWTAESDQANALFGGSVAAAGDVNADGYGDVIVGARSYDNGQTDEGRAYLYFGSPSGPFSTPGWTAESDQASANFGVSVATAGDVNNDGYADIIIGASTFDAGQPDEGRAFVYLGAPTGPSTTPAWTTESNQASALYGASVATAGDVNGDGYADVIVGARQYDNGQTDEGRAFVYLGSASGLSTTAAWTAEADQASANFGRSVATAGDVDGDGYADVIVGAYTYDNGQTDEGRAFVYLGSATGLGTTAAWTAENNQANSQFGITVAPGGDVNGDGYADVVVGSWLYDGGQTDEGAAYVYFGSATGLKPVADWTVEGNQSSAQYGWSVATAGDVNGDGYSDVIVGANLSDNGQVDEGRAFVYLGSATIPALTEGWAVDSNLAQADLGWSVASAGDVNGDGYSDVIVGAYQYASYGAAFLYLGSASGPAVTPSSTLSITGIIGFGYSVAAAGDVNGDGYADVIVGAPLGTTGRAYVYLGSPSGLVTPSAWNGNDGQNTEYGWSVASAGDVNGDGFSDIIVGSDAIGRAYVYYGSASGLPAHYSWQGFTIGHAASLFGTSVGTAGDVNRDGYSDVIIGAPNYDPVTGGTAFVYLGSPQGLAASPAWSASIGQPSGYFGVSVATAGDVNGDGYSDIIVGAENMLNPQGNQGGAYLFLGGPSGPSGGSNWFGTSPLNVSYYGHSVASAGDVNGDGFSDVLIGAYRYFWPSANEQRGQAFLYLGSASGLALQPSWNPIGPQSQSSFAISVAGAGDVNGDGYSDILVGAPYFHNGETNEGLALLYYGNGGRGRGGSVLQKRFDGSAPLALLGKSDSQTGMRFQASPRSAAGRTHQRLSWEIKPLDASFDGSLFWTGSWNYLGSTIDQPFNELAELTPYHWRLRIGTDSPFFPWSNWVSPAGNAPTEADVRTPGCLDLDGDGYGAPGDALCPAGLPTDCNDGNTTVHPGAVETCDGLDNNCNGFTDDTATPSGVPLMTAVRTSGSLYTYSWTSIINATDYDIVRGDLDVLRSSGGDFTVALALCASNDLASNSLGDAATPAADRGWFYLVRGVVGSCARGTYNTASPKQIGSRDAEIAASPAACP